MARSMRVFRNQNALDKIFLPLDLHDRSDSLALAKLQGMLRVEHYGDGARPNRDHPPSAQDLYRCGGIDHDMHIGVMTVSEADLRRDADMKTVPSRVRQTEIKQIGVRKRQGGSQTMPRQVEDTAPRKG